MNFKFKDKHGIDPRIIERRKARGLPALPEIEMSEPEIVYPGRTYCPACGQKITVSPFMSTEEGLRIHQDGCPRMKRDLIVIRRFQ